MTTPLKPMDREEWEKRIGHLAVLYQEFRDDEFLDSLWLRYAQSKSLLVDDILALQAQLTEALAEVDRLRGVFVISEKVLSLYEHFERNGEGRAYLYETIDVTLKKAIEKARQPK